METLLYTIFEQIFKSRHLIKRNYADHDGIFFLIRKLTIIIIIITKLSLWNSILRYECDDLSRKRFSHEYRTKFYITRCENADFRTRSVRKTAFSHTAWNKWLWKLMYMFFHGLKGLIKQISALLKKIRKSLTLLATRGM